MADNFLQALLAQVGVAAAPPSGTPIPMGAGIPNPNPGIVGSSAMGVGMSPSRLASINQAVTAMGVNPQAIPGVAQTLSPAEQIAQQIGTRPAAIRGALPAAGQTGMGAANIAGALPAAGQTASRLPAALAPASVAGPAAAVAAPVAQSAIGAAGAGSVAASEAATATGLMGRLGSVFPSLAGAQVSRAGLLKGGAASVAGLVASGWLDNQNFGGENSEMDQALKGGALGAGLGAGAALTLGLGAGPVGWAALAGAGIFAGANMIFGDNTTLEEKMDKKVDAANQTIDTIINNPQFGIDPDTASQIRLQVAATTEFYKNAKDEAGLTSYLESLAQTVPSFLMESSNRNLAQQQKMQLQASFGPVYSRMMDRSSTAAQQAFDIQMEAANAVSNPSVRAALQTQASQQYSAHSDLQAAYAQQITQSPQPLPPSAQMVQDQAQGLVQQAMGMGLAVA